MVVLHNGSALLYELLSDREPDPLCTSCDNGDISIE